MRKHKVPGVATVAINVKGADLLFLDHQNTSELGSNDLKMWRTAGVNVERHPFGRVIVYVPLKEDGINRNSLRSNPAADIQGYSETREFALGIQELWPYLDLFFDRPSSSISSLVAEIADYLNIQHPDGFTLADVHTLFAHQINKSKAERQKTPWSDFHASTIQAVVQRFRSLPATLKGLIDVTGTGFGLNKLTDLKPYDMVIIDIERIMANFSDPIVAESTIKVIAASVLKQLTETMTQRRGEIDHIIVFADELNRLAPRNGKDGIGEYLAQLARTTRDRGIVLFGAGQFRSSINEDILKAASVHYSMRTPEHELSDRIYAPLSSEFKARLTQLEPGQTLLQYPSLRTAVFAHFPRPFVVSGARIWQERFPPVEDRPLADCIYERLYQLDPERPPLHSQIKQLVEGLLSHDDAQTRKRIQADLIRILRTIEIAYTQTDNRPTIPPGEQFSQNALRQHGKQTISTTPMPPNFIEDDEEDE